MPTTPASGQLVGAPPRDALRRHRHDLLDAGRVGQLGAFAQHDAAIEPDRGDGERVDLGVHGDRDDLGCGGDVRRGAPGAVVHIGHGLGDEAGGGELSHEGADRGAVETGLLGEARPRERPLLVHEPQDARQVDETGVWHSAAANMRTYLLLKERAAAFRADPEVQEALAAARVAELAQPTFAEGETYADFVADRSPYEDFDADAYLGGKGFGFVRLQQLATEHLFGAR